MEDNEVLEAGINVNPELMNTIQKTVKDLKASNPELRAIFPIVVEGDEYDDKDYYVGYFRQPSFKAFSKYLSAAQSNQAVAMRVLAKDCFVAGDKALVDDDSLFMFGLMGQLGEIIKVRHSGLVNLSKPGK